MKLGNLYRRVTVLSASVARLRVRAYISTNLPFFRADKNAPHAHAEALQPWGKLVVAAPQHMAVIWPRARFSILVAILLSRPILARAYVRAYVAGNIEFSRDFRRVGVFHN